DLIRIERVWRTRLSTPQAMLTATLRTAARLRRMGRKEGQAHVSVASRVLAHDRRIPPASRSRYWTGAPCGRVPGTVGGAGDRYRPLLVLRPQPRRLRDRLGRGRDPVREIPQRCAPDPERLRPPQRQRPDGGHP